MKPGYTFRIITGVVFAAVILWSASAQRQARADIGWPPINPSGASPGVGEVNTNVRMVSEKVDLTIEPYIRSAPSGEMESPAYYMRGLVEASFQMRNLGQAQETLEVWFPLAASIRYPGLIPIYSGVGDIQDFKIWVGDVPVRTEIVKAPDLSDPQQESNWARFPITFPAGHNVIVRVTYTIYPSGRRPFGGFEYILQTGAGWKDTIGEAEITVYLPYSVHPDFVSLSGKSIEGLPLAPNPPGYRIDGNTIRWKFTDFEPTAESNIFVDVLEPDRYRRLLLARTRVRNEPDSVDAQLEMANAARNAVIVIYSVQRHGGGQKVADEANAAYRRALQLAPQRADIYSQYANWLRLSIGSGFFRGFGTCPEELCDLVRRGLEAFPNDPELNRIDEAIRLAQSDNATQSVYSTQYPLTETAKAEKATQSAYSATQKAELTAEHFRATRQALLVSRTPTQTTQPSATFTPVLATPIPTDLEISPEDSPGYGVVTIVLLGIVVVAVFLWMRRNPKSD